MLSLASSMASPSRFKIGGEACNHHDVDRNDMSPSSPPADFQTFKSSWPQSAQLFVASSDRSSCSFSSSLHGDFGGGKTGSSRSGQSGDGRAVLSLIEPTNEIHCKTVSSSATNLTSLAGRRSLTNAASGKQSSSLSLPIGPYLKLPVHDENVAAFQTLDKQHPSSPESADSTTFVSIDGNHAAFSLSSDSLCGGHQFSPASAASTTIVSMDSAFETCVSSPATDFASFSGSLSGCGLRDVDFKSRTEYVDQARFVDNSDDDEDTIFGHDEGGVGVGEILLDHDCCSTSMQSSSSPPSSSSLSPPSSSNSNDYGDDVGLQFDLSNKNRDMREMQIFEFDTQITACFSMPDNGIKKALLGKSEPLLQESSLLDAKVSRSGASIMHTASDNLLTHQQSRLRMPKMCCSSGLRGSQSVPCLSRLERALLSSELTLRPISDGLGRGVIMRLAQIDARSQNLTTESGSSPDDVSSDLPISVDEADKASDDMDLLHNKIHRSSSLKSCRSPEAGSSTKQSGMKIVRFADVFGLALADVKTFFDDVPHVPSAAFKYLTDLNECGGISSGADQQMPGISSSNSTSSIVQMPVCLASVVVSMFRQPNLEPSFMDRLKYDNICLEDAQMTVEGRIYGTIRVRNVTFEKRAVVRYTRNEWLSYNDIPANYVADSCDGFSDRFQFDFASVAGPMINGQRVQFALRFQAGPIGSQTSFWDNNRGQNYIFQCCSNPSRTAAASNIDGGRLNSNSNNSNSNNRSAMARWTSTRCDWPSDGDFH